MRRCVQYILLAVWFFSLNFLSYGKSLGLSLYGDDWFITSIFFANYGPTGIHPYWRSPELIFSNYGSQFFVMPILYSLFGEYALPYFLLSMLFRLCLIGAIFVFVRKIISPKAAFVTASFFAVTSIGAETTDWMYNMPSYLGSAFVIFGLSYFIVFKSFKESLVAWFWLLTGYFIAIIRLFFIPFFLVVLTFFRRYSAKRPFLETLLGAFSVFTPFIIFKFIFPDIGFQPGYLIYVGDGLKIAMGLFAEGRFDIVVYPFVFLGRMLLPWGVEDLAYRTGLQVYPLSMFLFTGSAMAFLGAFILWFTSKRATLKSFVVSLVFSTASILALKIFIRYQGLWMLKDFSYFVWAFFGIIVFLAICYSVLESVLKRNWSKTAYWILTLGFTISFVFPWLYDPRSIFIAQHRYLIAPAIGMTLFTGLVFYPRKSFRYLQLLFLGILVFVQIVSSRNFFDMHYKARNWEAATTLYAQLRKEIPYPPTGIHSVVYIEGAPPLLFEELFRFGFGYHMQLFYKLKFVQEDFPYGIGTWSDLVSAVSDPAYPRLIGDKRLTPIENVFAFRLTGDRLINITDETRKKLRNITSSGKN